MAVIVENEDSDMEFFGIPQEGMYGQPNKNSSTSGGSTLKRKQDNQKEEVCGYSDVDTMNEEEATEGGSIKECQLTGNVHTLSYHIV